MVFQNFYKKAQADPKVPLMCPQKAITKAINSQNIIKIRRGLTPPVANEKM